MNHKAFLREMTEHRPPRVRGNFSRPTPPIIPLDPQTVAQIQALKAARVLGSWEEDGHYIPPDPEAVEAYDRTWKHQGRFHSDMPRYSAVAARCHSVYAYLRAHGPATRREIADGLDIPDTIARVALDRLYQQRRIGRVAVRDATGHTPFQYHAILEDT